MYWNREPPAPPQRLDLPCLVSTNATHSSVGSIKKWLQTTRSETIHIPGVTKGCPMKYPTLPIGFQTGHPFVTPGTSRRKHTQVPNVSQTKPAGLETPRSRVWHLTGDLPIQLLQPHERKSLCPRGKCLFNDSSAAIHHLLHHPSLSGFHQDRCRSQPVARAVGPFFRATECHPRLKLPSSVPFRVPRSWKPRR